MERLRKFDIKTEADFYQVLEEIDQELKNDGVKLTARSMQGWSYFCDRFNLELNWREPLSVKIFDWFNQRYGEKLCLDIERGVASIRGDFFGILIPRVWGKCKIVCEPITMGIGRENLELGIDSPPTLNVLNNIEGLTKTYASKLTRIELLVILDIFIVAINAFSSISKISDITLVNQAKADIRASVNFLINWEPNYGLSKWSSLQASEKFVKAYIQSQGKDFQKIHDLQKLTNKAQLFGLREVSATLLEQVKCSPSVRYGETAVEPREAFNAYYAAIRICADIAEQLPTYS